MSEDPAPRRRRCWGRTPTLRRCRRSTAGQLFCEAHRYQLLTIPFLVVVTVGGALASYYGAFTAWRGSPRIVKPSDLQVRFDVGSYQLSQEHLLKAPKAIRCDARIGRLPLSFDLILLETLERTSLGGGRGRPLPTFSYNGTNFAFRGPPAELTFDSVLGKELRFGLPYGLQELAGPETMYQITVHVGNDWFVSGFQKFERGMVTLELGRRR